jgi:hypothetical protein
MALVENNLGNVDICFAWRGNGPAGLHALGRREREGRAREGAELRLGGARGVGGRTVHHPGCVRLHYRLI